MNIYTFGIVVVALLVGAVVVTQFIELKKKQVGIQAKIPQSNKPGSWEAKLDGLPFALDQSIKLFNDMIAQCDQQIKEGKMKQEDAEKILKPLQDRINLMKKVQDFEPAARMGARIGDKVSKLAERYIDDLE
jgi:hypothetical protein